METMNIHSSLYDYTVDFVEDFSQTMKQFGDRVAYVIDKNIFAETYEPIV